MKWIDAIPTHLTGRKTEGWLIVTKDRQYGLGEVKFYPRWRKYAFFPDERTLYEADCLRDIAQFCEDATKGWHEAIKMRNRLREKE